jgi:triosephosphate isomerase
MSRKAFVCGNWKMHRNTSETVALVRELRAKLNESSSVEVGIAPPFTALGAAGQALVGSFIRLSGQNCHFEKQGAFTGEVSAAMLKDVGCDTVILGHSERRQFFGETDAVVNKRARAALDEGLTPIVCVGETLQEREAGQTEDVVKRQLAAVIQQVGHCITEIVVAYEPVWAIGTGRTASPEQAQAVHALLRAQLNAATANAQGIHLLYGGSMNASNAASLLAQPDIDGGLVGGASLKPTDFLAIVAAAQALSSAD